MSSSSTSTQTHMPEMVASGAGRGLGMDASSQAGDDLLGDTQQQLELGTVVSPEEETRLLSFLRGVVPLVTSQLSSLNRVNLDFALQALGSLAVDEEEAGRSGVVSTLRAPLEQPSEEGVEGGGGAAPPPVVSLCLPAVALSWSSTGLLAAAFGRRDHGGWCRHTGGVGVWGFSRGPRGTLDTLLECPSCVTSVAFHPERPSLLAAGLHSGEVRVWDLTQGGGVGASNAAQASPPPPLARSPKEDYLHREPVVGLCWTWDPYLKQHTLMSTCSEGKVHVWAPLMNLLAHPLASYFLGEAGKGDSSSSNKRKATAATTTNSALKHLGCTGLGVGGGGGGGGGGSATGTVFFGTHKGAVARCSNISIGPGAMASLVQGGLMHQHQQNQQQPLITPPGLLHPGIETTLPWEAGARETLLSFSGVLSPVGAAPTTAIASSLTAAAASAVRAVERVAREGSATRVTQRHVYMARALPFPLPPSTLLLQGHLSGVCATSVAASPCHRNLLASTGADGTLSILSALLRAPLLSMDPPHTLTSSSNTTLSGGEGGGGANALAVGTPSTSPSSSSSSSSALSPLTPLLSCAWSPSRPLLLATGTSCGAVHVYDLFVSTSSTQPAVTLLGNGEVSGEVGGGGGRGGGGEGEEGGDPLLPSGGGTSGALAIAFHPKQRRLLAVAYSSGEVVLWRLPRGMAQPVKGETEALEAFLKLSMSSGE